MDYSEIICISKLPGLYQIHKKRTDGLIVKPIGEDKSTFASSRNHVFTPLENITIYTDDEPVELKVIIEGITKNKSKLPDAQADGEVLKSFFGTVLPNYDREKVYVSDMKKIVKWYKILDDNNLLEELSKPKEETKKEAEKTSAKEETEAKTPKKTTKTTKATKKTTKS